MSLLGFLRQPNLQEICDRSEVSLTTIILVYLLIAPKYIWLQSETFKEECNSFARAS